MQPKKDKKLSVFSILALTLCFCFFLSGPVLADSSKNVTGFAWSENIGWISFNNSSGGGGIDYGVNIEEDGKISGYAWSENIGWITFNESDLTGCPSAPCRAWVDTTCPSGQCAVNGWAKVLANGGGWDGWIKLGGTAQDGSPYPLYIAAATGDFHGWAWSDMVIGWISFNCQEPGSCGSSNYKVKTTKTFQRGPEAVMSCNSSQCWGGTCNGSVWISYRPAAEPTPCIYKVKNDSTDPDGPGDITLTDWYYKVQGADDSTYIRLPGCPQYAGISDCTIQTSILAGNYTIKLVVTDSTANSDYATHDITIKSEVRADFMCSLDNANWQICSNLSGKVAKDETIYLKDDPSLSYHSIASEGESIVTREWSLNGVVFGGNETAATTNLLVKNNVIELKVTDSVGRSDYQEYNLSAKSLPEWEEVNPTAMMINKFLAGIYRFWSR